MKSREAVAKRITDLCNERGIIVPRKFSGF